MRSVLDPKRHYKKETSKPHIPEYSQVGTIIEGPTEYFSARLSNKQRKQTFVEEVLATEASTGRFKNKYGEIQAAKTSGKKAHYKALKAKRSAPGRVSKGWMSLRFLERNIKTSLNGQQNPPQRWWRKGEMCGSPTIFLSPSIIVYPHHEWKSMEAIMVLRAVDYEAPIASQVKGQGYWIWWWFHITTCLRSSTELRALWQETILPREFRDPFPK